MTPISRLFTTVILIVLILAFGFYFSWYSIQRYQTLNAYTADLSLIDQAIWNTGQGRFLEATWGENQQPRIAEHFEPILIPLAGVYWIWDDVRAILIIQAFALALGALPVYWLAKDILSNQDQGQMWLPLVFPFLYLLSPPLQAAAMADFHADPLMVAPFLFSFWYATQHKWRWMWFWAIVVMLSKENMPTLIVMLGGYLLITGWLKRRMETDIYTRYFKQGFGLILVGIGWFLIATFIIVAPLAEIYFDSAGPIYLANRFSLNPLDWIQVTREPARFNYLVGLILTTGGLALLAPQYLLLGLPIFVANIFSNFSGQYSGEQHYSAPLVAVLTIAAIYGTRNAILLIHTGTQSVANHRHDVSRNLVSSLIIITFAIVLIYQMRFGWTPASRRAETYVTTPHIQLAHQLLARIPPDVPISASAALHPHLAHRAVAYTFPTVQEAEFIIIDVTDVPGLHPNDVRAKLEEYLASGQWQILEASDGLVLLEKSAQTAPPSLPDSFYSFVRGAIEATPTFPMDLNFANQIKLLGFDVLDDPFHAQTTFQFYWQALDENLAEDLHVFPQVFDNFGRPHSPSGLQPSVATTWYPPSLWRKGEIIITKTLPQNFGQQSHLAVGITREKTFGDNGQRLAIKSDSQDNPGIFIYANRTWAHIASFTRGNWALMPAKPRPTLQSLRAVSFSFRNQLTLIGLHIPATIEPDHAVPILLAWQADKPIETDYTIFIHVLDQAGNVVAQNDAQPFWLTEQPMTQWQADQMVLDSHILPASLPTGVYQVRLGLYQWQTLERLPLYNGSDSIIIGDLIVE